MKSFGELKDETNHAGVEFLFTELGSCDTFLNVADTTKLAETRSRNLENAHVANKSLLRYRTRLLFDAAKQSEYETRLTELARRLMEAGLAL